METWRIAIPIVVFILCVIGAWYVIRLRIKEIRSRTYVYPKTGHKYMPLYRCRMKNPVTVIQVDGELPEDMYPQ